MSQPIKGSDEYMQLLTVKLVEQRIITPCVNCDYFDEPSELCSKFAGDPARPPARILATGCPMWRDTLPF